MNDQKSLNALTIIDGIVGSLSRGGPGREVEISFKDSEVPTWLPKYGKLLGLRPLPTNYLKNWKMHGSSCFEALHLTRSVLEVLNDSIPKIGLLPVEDQLGFFLQARDWPNELFTKFAKFSTAWPMARYLQQDLPEKPEGFPCHPLVFPGRIKRILKNRLVSFNDRNSRLWGSYLQGIKRGAAPVSEQTVHEAMLKHRRILSTPPKGDDTVLDELEPLIQRALRNFRFKEPRLYEASTSASYNNKRSEGGAREYCRDLYSEEEGADNLLRMVETRPGRVQELRGVYPPSFEQVLSEAFKVERPYKVQVSAVLEPLKTRLITKGEALPYWLSKSAQKDMWGFLQGFPQFRLTGRPMSGMDLHGLLQREAMLGFEFDQWVSGDYSSATDGVDIRVTMTIMEAMLSRSDFDERYKEVLRGVIGPQVIEYPNAQNREGDLDPFMQANGQLMGSTLSFPILCLINLVGYWGALEEYSGKRLRMKDLPVLINGDDILFRSDARLYEIWKRWVDKVGFTLSLGKNYIHPDMLTINSELYRHVRGSNKFVFLGYLNCGLLTGQSKITGRDYARKAPIWDFYNETVPNSVNPERTHRRFIHYHRKAIEEATNRGEFNLFLPFNRGGLGFQAVQPSKLTSFQRRFATYLEKRYLENVNEGKVPKGETIGLVRTEKSETRVITPYHNPKVLLGPKIGPLKENCCFLETPTHRLPVLALLTETERPEFKIRLPRRAKVAFRKFTSAAMSDQTIHEWPWRLVEELDPIESSLEAGP